MSKNYNKQTRPRKLWVCIFTVLGIVIAVQLIVSNLLAGKGEHMAELERNAAKIARENQSLQEDLAQQSSLTKLSESAKASGFEKPTSIIYLDSALPVAQASQ